MSETSVSTAAATYRLRPPHNRLDRRAVLWWAATNLGFGGLVVVAASVANYFWDWAGLWLPIGLAVVTVLDAVIEPLWRFRVHRWEATDKAVYSLTGWVVREWRVAPISRIQTVDAVRGPLERWLGLATLKVTTASSSGTIDIVGLDAEVAAELAEKLTEITQQTPGDAT